MESILDNFKKWMELDPNVESREFINGLFKKEKWLDLNELLNNRVIFGTAGLRAEMGPGFSKMNNITVLQASQGLADYILKTLNNNEDKNGSIVIGHDHRFNSEEFANITASIFLIAGFNVYFIGKGICATPMVPFAVDLLNAKAGIMITASHNPKNDNGYKVYWSNGCQIIPPLDQRIQDSILNNLNKWNDFNWDSNLIFNKFNDKLHYCKDSIVPKYIKHLKEILLKCDSIKGFQCVYTPMHGVGNEFVNLLMDSINCSNVLLNLNSQSQPNPNFPTVSFPNPEEKGALDLSIEYAESISCPLVIANDPDADRFSFAYKFNNEWKQFTGNEIGILFADFIISSYKQNNENLSKIWLLNSTVSSQMIKSMAKIEGFNYIDTLTGFKWIGNKAIDLEKKGFIVPFAYEEAIGFMFPTVHDKDGISALLIFLQMYQWYLKLNTNPFNRLKSLYQKYGFFKECNGYFKTMNTNVIFNENIRSGGIPKSIGDWKVLSWRDLTIGYDSDTVDNIPILPTDSNSQMITSLIEKEGTKVRFTLRGSGTEPKLKVYIESNSVDEIKAEKAAKSVWELLKTEFNLNSN